MNYYEINELTKNCCNIIDNLKNDSNYNIELFIMEYFILNINIFLINETLEKGLRMCRQINHDLSINHDYIELHQLNDQLEFFNLKKKDENIYCEFAIKPLMIFSENFTFLDKLNALTYINNYDNTTKILNYHSFSKDSHRFVLKTRNKYKLDNNFINFTKVKSKKCENYFDTYRQNLFVDFVLNTKDKSERFETLFKL